MNKPRYSAILLVVLATLLLSPAAHACLNDRDTLAEEIQGLPDVVQIITGRFPRNPPLYYQMRVDRLTKAIPADPSNLDNYDDIGVALDRLGRDDEAIGWLEQKRARLVALNASETDPAYKELWYRYYANVGTCWVHRWISHGADRSKIDQVQTARDYIAQAVAIKPDAHEGREKYQLMAMDWMMGKAPSGSEYAQTQVTHTSNAADGPSMSLGKFIWWSSDDRDALRGLSGLVALGGAWESPDIFDAIAYASVRHWPRQPHIAIFARLRTTELLHSGSKFLEESYMDDGSSAYSSGSYANPDNNPDSADYRMLRREADTWQAKRTAYMIARLTAGRHPDTDPTFWSGWHDYGPPQMPIPLDRRIFLALGKPGGSQANFYGLLFFWSFILVVAIGVYIDAIKRGRRKSTAAIWAIGSVVALCIVVPIWLIVRPSLVNTPMVICRRCSQSTPADAVYCKYCDMPITDNERPAA